MLNKRTHILFDEQLWNQLVQAAKEKQTSVGELVRTSMREEYGEGKVLSARAKAIDKILELKKHYKTKAVKKESVVELVRRMREERTQHIWNVLEKARRQSK